MAAVKHFTDLHVWRRSHQLFLEILGDVEQFPRSLAARIIADQILRSCMSISANISEGFNRTQKYSLNCLAIAAGSSNETENWLYKLRDAGFLSSDRARILIDETSTIRKMLYGLMAQIRNR